MFNPLRSTTLGALEQTLAFTEKRHKLLAGNIANMGVPGYRGRDLDVKAFQSALADSIRGDQKSPADQIPQDPTSPFTSPAELFHRDLAILMGSGTESGPLASHPFTQSPIAQGTDGLLGDPAISGANSSQPTSKSEPTRPENAMGKIIYHDGSDTSLEEQVTQLSKNKHLHDLAVTTMRSQFELMRAAITERA